MNVLLGCVVQLIVSSETFLRLYTRRIKDGVIARIFWSRVGVESVLPEFPSAIFNNVKIVKIIVQRVI